MRQIVMMGSEVERAHRERREGISAARWVRRGGARAEIRVMRWGAEKW